MSESPTRNTLPARPDLPLDRVVWRVDSEPYQNQRSSTGYVARFVPYLKASILADLLDQWVGPDNWRDIYQEGQLAGRAVLWCHLEVRFGDEWVRKSDVGVPPAEKRNGGEGMAPKGAVSDAFKRAVCLKWGLGREVYEMPTLKAPCGQYQRGDRNVAYPVDATKPELIRQLKNLGFGVSEDSIRTDDGYGDEDQPEPAPKPASQAAAENAGDTRPFESSTDTSTGDDTPASTPPAAANGNEAADALFDSVKELIADGKTNASKVLVAARKVSKDMGYDEPPRSFDDIPAAMGPDGVMALIESLTPTAA